MLDYATLICRWLPCYIFCHYALRVIRFTFIIFRVIRFALRDCCHYYQPLHAAYGAAILLLDIDFRYRFSQSFCCRRFAIRLIFMPPLR